MVASWYGLFARFGQLVLLFANKCRPSLTTAACHRQVGHAICGAKLPDCHNKQNVLFPPQGFLASWCPASGGEFLESVEMAPAH